MKSGSRQGFTLIEILLVVGLIGIIAAAALAPLLFTVNSLDEAQKQRKIAARERNAVEGLFSDVRSAVHTPYFSSVRSVRGGGLTIEDDDRLLVWSASPIHENGVVSLIVYRVMASSAFDNAEGGLYRWVLSGPEAAGRLSAEAVSDIRVRSSKATSVSPLMFDTDTLKTNNGKLLLRGVDGLRISAWSGSEWAQEYEGPVPDALKIEISIKGKKHEYEEWFPVLRR